MDKKWRRLLWKMLDWGQAPQHPAQRVSPQAINQVNFSRCEFCNEMGSKTDPRHLEGRCALWTRGWTPSPLDRQILNVTGEGMRRGYPPRDVI